MKRKIKTLFTMSIIIHLLHGCSKAPQEEPQPDISQYTIHVAGQSGYMWCRVGCYWKNDERTDFNSYESDTHVTVTGMSVSNENVYISGHYRTYEMTYKAPCYWKNGVKIDLPLNGNYGGYTNDIFVSGNDIYIAGMYITAEQNNTQTLQPCYWKNNTLIEITDYPDLEITITEDYDYPFALPPVELTCIYVSDGDIYIGGNYDIGVKKDKPWAEPKQACYWKNNIKTDLQGNNSFVSGIFVKDGKVYVSGGCDFMGTNKNNKVGLPCYWENGQKVDLPNIEPSASTSDIFVDNGTVYVSGNGGFVTYACYWKDKVQTVLEYKHRTISYAYIKSIFIKDGIVFTIGGIMDLRNNEHCDIPCYWVNKKRYDLSIIDRSGDAFAIFVE